MAKDKHPKGPCRSLDCLRAPCRAYQLGFQEGKREGLEEGREEGREEAEAQAR